MYECIPKSASTSQQLDALVQHTRHLTDRREEEFGEALVPVIAEAEGVDIAKVTKVGA